MWRCHVLWQEYKKHSETRIGFVHLKSTPKRGIGGSTCPGHLSSFPSLLLHKGQGQRLHKHMNFLGFFCGHESFWKADEKLIAPSLKKKMSMYIKYCIQLHQVYLLHPESHAGTTPPPLGYQEPCSKQSPHSSALGPPWHFKRVFNWGLEMSHPIYPSFQSNTSTECHVSHPRG